ncbi:MAG: Rpn family recombination-promoting nuclease/putative transposase [Verrucomicrobia bacterium]|nr:MAG: Rpn family recombination-promoting nuclease/putative transposase [Verrucomicrobiota bacterium]
MSRYLDPKNDLTFKRIFGEHKHLLMSLLNALLPLSSPVVEVEYISNELVPEVPYVKHSVVDVRCKDLHGRQFLVEMQMLWSESFKQRVVFNASKAYVKQLRRGQEWSAIQPVYVLALVNDVFDHQSAAYYHHFAIVNLENPTRRLDGMEFVFVELPKFHQKEDNMKELWLSFLTDIKDQTRDSEVAERLKLNSNIREALGCLEESSYNDEELEAYDTYWDEVSSEKTLMTSARLEGHAEGRAEGLQEALQRLIASGMSEPQARQSLGL